MTAANDGGMSDSADFLFSPSVGGWIVSAAYARKLQRALAQIGHESSLAVGSALRRLGCIGVSHWFDWRKRAEPQLSEADCMKDWQALDAGYPDTVFQLAGTFPVSPYDHDGKWFRVFDFEETAIVGIAQCLPKLPPTGGVAAALLYLIVDRGKAYPRELGLDRDIPQFSAATRLLDEMRWAVHYTNFNDEHEDFAEFYDGDDEPAVEAREKFMLSTEFEDWLDGEVVRLTQRGISWEEG